MTETVYAVQTIYGVETKPTLAEAKEFARYAAITTGTTCKIVKVTEEKETVASVPAPRPEAGHDSPCVCGTYDRCAAQRAADARRKTTVGAAFRARHRAYND